eukprot:scaffold8941_cov44-Phaeocystis_antarctica.AAC.1
MTLATPSMISETISSAQRPSHPRGEPPRCQWPRTPPGPLCGILAQRADMWNPVPLGRSVFDGVEQLVLDVGAFAVKLGDDLVDFVGKLPSPAGLMQLAIDGIKKELFKDNGLCLAPSCPGYHINSGVEEDLVPGLDDLEILASHRMITHSYRIIPPTQRARIDHASRRHIALSDTTPSIVTPIARPHSRGRPVCGPMWQALTSLSVCFNMYDFGLDATGLRDAITDFWENNPAVKDVQPVQKRLARAAPQRLAFIISG